MLEAIGLFVGFVVAMISLNASASSQRQQNQYNKELVDQQNQYNKEALELQSQLNREFWKEQNEYNLPVNQMQRLADAGINKNLAASYIQGNSAQLSAPTVTPNIAAGKNAFNPQDILGNVMNMFSGAGNRVQQNMNLKVQTQNAKIQADILNLNKQILQGKRDASDYALQMRKLQDNFLVQDKDGNYVPAWMLKVQGEGARANMQIHMSQFLPLEAAAKLQKYADDHNISELNAQNIAAIIKERGEKHKVELRKMGIEIDNLVAKLESQEFQNQLNSLMTPKMMQEYVQGQVDKMKSNTYAIAQDRVWENLLNDKDSPGYVKIFVQAIRVLEKIFGQ